MSALAKQKNIEEKATTGVDPQQATEIQAMLEVELPVKCRHSNKRVKKTQCLISLMFHKQEHSYAFPTWLGRCQSLDASQVGASYEKEGYSHKIHIAAKQCKFIQSWLNQHMASVFNTI